MFTQNIFLTHKELDFCVEKEWLGNIHKLVFSDSYEGAVKFCSKLLVLHYRTIHAGQYRVSKVSPRQIQHADFYISRQEPETVWLLSKKIKNDSRVRELAVEHLL